MAKLVRRSNFFKRKKKWEHFKNKTKNTILRMSVLINGCLAMYIYDPTIIVRLTNNYEYIYQKVALIVESLINQLPL